LEWAAVLIAFLLDLVIGDPKFLPHPVKLIGSLINKTEACLRLFAHDEVKQRLAGIFLVLFILIVVYGGTAGLCWLATQVSPILQYIVIVWLISTTIAARGLADVGGIVYRHLAKKETEQAREIVNGIVGRDTENMDEREMVRATVETLAENIVDAIVAPLFYAFLGGAPLAMAYRAVNTLDSMVGYRNPQYFYFGWASARLDDLANYIPARITGLLLVIAAFFCRYQATEAVRIILRDSGKHPSPNSGIPESGVAGALGICLGGTNYYGGVPSYRPLMGNPSGRELDYSVIPEAVKLLYGTGILAVLCGAVLCCFFSG